MGAFGEAHNHNIPSDDTERTIRAYLDRGILYVMIQTNVPDAPAKVKDLINRPDSVDVLFANGSFTASGGHPTALVRRNIANGGMTNEDLDGGFLQPVRSREDIDRVWSTRIKQQHPDFIKLTLVYSEDRVADLPRPYSDRHGLDPSLTSYLVGKAHGDRLRVSAHVESAYDFEFAVAAESRVTSASDNQGHQVRYEYDVAGRLASVTDGNRTWRYEYNGTYLTSVQSPEGRWLLRARYDHDRISEIELADRRMFRFSFVEPENRQNRVLEAIVQTPGGSLRRLIITPRPDAK